jgi:hypothetical protein
MAYSRSILAIRADLAARLRRKRVPEIAVPAAAVAVVVAASCVSPKSVGTQSEKRMPKSVRAIRNGSD